MKLRLGLLLLAKLNNAESGFEEGVTLQENDFISIDVTSESSVFDEKISEESSGTSHYEDEEVAVIFTEEEPAVDVPRGGGKKRVLESNPTRGKNRNHEKKTEILERLEQIESELEEKEIDNEIKDEESTMIIAIAAGVGCLFMLSVLLLAACCVSRKRRRARHESNREKQRRVEANPAEQTFERLDFNQSIGTSKRQKKKAESEGAKPAEGGDVTSSEMAPSSMGTLRTYIDRSNATMVKHCLAGNESDFRNTSSDIDSIESSNPPKGKMHAIHEKKKKYSGYQELATRERSNYSSSSSGSSCEHVMGIGPMKTAPTTHHVIVEETGAPPAYETLTRSRDSVIDL